MLSLSDSWGRSECQTAELDGRGGAFVLDGGAGDDGVIAGESAESDGNTWLSDLTNGAAFSAAEGGFDMRRTLEECYHTPRSRVGALFAEM